MSRYLDKFRSTMPVAQGRQIFQLLSGLKDIGAIKSVDEFNSKLQELSEHLRSTSPQPLFKLFKAVLGDVVDSDKFNAMVSAIGMDLETAFSEAENVAIVLELHKALHKLTVLESLQQAVDDLSRTIALYEFFRNDHTGYNQAQFNTFNSTAGYRTEHTGTAASDFFFDWRRNINLLEEDDCQIDIVGQQLIMPAESLEEIKVVDVGLIEDGETISSTIDLQQVTSSLRNIIDQQKHTYWVYPVIRNTQETGGIRLKLKLDLGGIRQFNIMEIEPACHTPMILEKVQYIGEDSETHTITTDATINTPTSFCLGELSAQYITLTFKQETCEQLLYYHYTKRDIWDRVWKEDLNVEQSDSNRVDRIALELRTEIPDSKVQDILGIPADEEVEKIVGYQYTFGIDNIRFYLEKYKQTGVFVGERFEVEKPGLIGLRVAEVNPTVSIANASYKQFSFEYTLTKRDYDANGSFLKTEYVPILPINNSNYCENERLFFTKQDNSSVRNVTTLRFTPDVRSGTPVIYQNLTTALTIGDDYVVKAGEQASWQEDWDDVRDYIDTYSATESAPMVVYVKILDPSFHSIYTTSYYVSTRMSDAGTSKQRKLSDFIFLHDTGTLRCLSESDKGTAVAKSELYLTVVMRNNYIYDTSTAALQEYKLLVSTYDDTKFSE